MQEVEVTLGSIEKLPRRMNSGLSFLLVLRGSLLLEVNGEQRHLREGDITVLDHTDLYSVGESGANVTVMIGLSWEWLSLTCPEMLHYRFRCNSAGADPASEPLYATIKRNISRMAFLYFKREEGYELLLRSVLFETLHELCLAFRIADNDTASQTPADRMVPILAYIHSGYKNRISLDEIAAREYMSVQYLSRLFRQKMGVTFLEYVADLRLKSAVEDLVKTKDSATKIALNNGFASAKAMAQQFSRTYGLTPAEYRQKYAAVPAPEETGRVQLLPEGKRSLDALVRFIDEYERRGEQIANVERRLVLRSLPATPLSRFDGIVDIGDIRYALRADTRRQLAAAQANLGLTYIYFRGFGSGLTPEKAGSTIFETYDFFETFNLFSETGLVPFIRLDVADLLAYSGLPSALEALTRLLTSLRRSQSPAYFSRWLFELVGQPRQLSLLFPPVAAAIRSVAPGLCVGIRVEPEDLADREEWGATVAALLGQEVSFLTYPLDPNRAAAPTDAAAYEAFHDGYHERMTSQVESWAALLAPGGVPLYLVDWNTLTGKSTVEAGEFHRTALVADVLVRLSGRVAGFGMRLSLFSGNIVGGLITHALSLFVYRNIRRPMFFVFRAFAGLKAQQLTAGEHTLLTTDGAERWALLVYNPCYMDPFHSLDNIRRGMSSRNYKIVLEGLPPGRYRVKQYLMDKDNGSLYHSWVKLDLNVPLDEEDLDEYLENVSNPSMLLYETEVSSDLTLQQELSMNATTLYVIKRFG